MAVSVTNTDVVTVNTEYAVTKNAATSTVIDATEVFTITPTKGVEKVLIFIEVTAGDQGAVAYSVAAGEFWAATSALTGSVAQGTTDVITLETAKYMAQAGTIAITFTPASGKRLLTDHALKVYVVEAV